MKGVVLRACNELEGFFGVEGVGKREKSKRYVEMLSTFPRLSPLYCPYCTHHSCFLLSPSPFLVSFSPPTLFHHSPSSLPPSHHPSLFPPLPKSLFPPTGSFPSRPPKEKSYVWGRKKEYRGAEFITREIPAPANHTPPRPPPNHPPFHPPGPHDPIPPAHLPPPPTPQPPPTSPPPPTFFIKEKIPITFRGAQSTQVLKAFF